MFLVTMLDNNHRTEAVDFHHKGQSQTFTVGQILLCICNTK